MSIRKLGQHHFRVDLNESNIHFISQLVTDAILEGLEEKCKPGELLHYHQIEDRVRTVLLQRQPQIQEKINQSCDLALEKAPTKSNRANLFGRALVEKIITYPETEEEWLTWFKRNYLKNFLEQVRISMGVQNFDYFNDLLDIALQNECLIRDLKQSRINWDGFFAHKRLTLMFAKARNLRHWMCVLNNQEIFLAAVNRNRKKEVREFQSKDLWYILDAWEFNEEE